MKRKLLNLIQGGVIAAIITSCASSETESTSTPPETFKISVASKIANLQADDKEKKIKVTASSEEWRAEVIDEVNNNWITVTASTEKSESHVVIKTTVNDDIVSRTAKVRVVALKSAVADTIKVSQLGTYPDILLSTESTIEFPAVASNLPLEITANTSYNIEIISEDNWIKEVVKGRAMVKYNHNFTIEQNKGSIRVGKITICSKGVDPEIVREIEITQGRPGGEIVAPKDKLFHPVAARASDSENERDARFVFDDYLGSYWCSAPEQNDPVANFPKWLEVDMGTEATSLDYMIFYPVNGNGKWGQVDIMYNTRTSDTWIPIVSEDFKQVADVQTIFFPTTLENVKTIRFSIASGSSNQASCREVELYQYNKDNDLIKSIDKVFKTKACMELKDNVQDEDISALPAVLQDVANGLRSGTYTKEFRMGTYVAHSSPEYWAEKLKTMKWGQADNPTGIWAKKGEKIIILVGNTWGNKIQFFSCDAFVNAFGDNYMLREGVNEITVKNDGLFYVKYYVDNLHAFNNKPIEVHIPQGYGYVNGYWDLALHKTDAEYERIYKMSTTPFRMFDIVGKHTHLIYSRGFIPEIKIVDALAWYDKFCWWDLEVMGVDKLYDRGDINHRYVFVSNNVEGSMDATNYRTRYPESTLMNCLQESIMKSKRGVMWGPAHEVGHMNQKAINFHGFTEASNNFFSNLFYYKNNWGFKSAGPGVQAVIDVGFANKNVKINVGTATEPDYKTFPRTPFLLIPRVSPGDVFMLARPYWQLYTYYHIAGKNPQFWPTYFELLRQAPNFTDYQAQENSMNNYILACDAAQEDLTDFFEHWGFFVPLDIFIDDYGRVPHKLTQEMIDAAKAKVKAKGYKKAAPIEYIEDRDVMDKEDAKWLMSKGQTGYWEDYRDNVKIPSNISVSLTNNQFIVHNYLGTAGFEFIDNGVVLVKSVKAVLFVPEASLSTGKLYAVQVDGERVLIWPK